MDKKNDIIDMIENMPENQKESVRWYIDRGDDDIGASQYSALVHTAMYKKGIPHKLRIRDGKHNWDYWRSALPEVLDFVSDSFDG